MASKRVSAKQRLELITVALAEFNSSAQNTTGTELDDYVAFVDAVNHALFDKLEPRGGGEAGSE